MPTSVGFVTGEFKYKEQFKLGEHGVVLVGEIEQGTIAPKLLLELDGGRSLPILGVEGYGKGTKDFGLLFLDAVLKEFQLTPGRTYFVTQKIPVAKSREESTFDLMSKILSIAMDLQQGEMCHEDPSNHRDE